MRHRRMRAAAIAATMGLAVGFAPPAAADTGADSGDLRAAVSAKNIMSHLKALQAAAKANGGNRAAGTRGYEKSARYIEDELKDAGYKPVRQRFTYHRYDFVAAALERISPMPRIYGYGATDGFLDMHYSGAGEVTARVSDVDINLAGDRGSTSGCERADFSGFPSGHIALIQRGTCGFRDKVDNAVAAGAAGVIVFNQGDVVPGDDRMGLFGGTLEAPQVKVPVLSTTFDNGAELAAFGAATLRLAVDATVTRIRSFNILADTGGRADRKVVVGAHLDSVGEGPGINDNGTGVGAILETAIQLKETGEKARNRVRFAFWGGEEDGLIGSDYYVSRLSDRQLKDHAVNLNFDMVGSPNYVRYVYDGDGSSYGEAGPDGSGVVERVFLDYFASQNLPAAPTALDGRSDYFGFIENGIPAGGLFTGAEDLKTPEEAAIFGGTAGAPHDPCYHAACDTLANVNTTVLDQMADAIAHATLTFAQTKSAINGTATGKGFADLQFKGPSRLR
ncbi:Zn-dependent M28 family amino/carboxypeptidase [Arthrobacter sp. V4I6]|uniref:M20/M25/M40 family metallo-hydrolase n=1 Tax=unclassified Arthrobacter TaxID=235627 RepID=UPI002782AD5E|nr:MULTISPECIES: M20/M25/M40 family metallo-hydrolase [unclassified Arthrobacter]MDQ0821703.1 Zn-dependent M28 family amino/carboxypeptidase [Arthrobacter sp. V1I7]MDQ0855968.1 Zn-dependent M28 family amino/carboxypeptidase [Arthrobacter sp. V4I6]